MNLSYKQLSLNESIEIIESNNYCHVALSLNNKPYVIPMNYKFVKNNENIYCLELYSLKDCKKMQIIENNNFVNINIEETFNNSMFSIICYGRVVNVNPYNDYIVKVIIKLDYISGRIISENNK